MSLFADIAILNRKKDIAAITVTNLGQYNLLPSEKKLLKKYTPENKLVVYGTLAPGKPNNHKLAHIKGEWLPALLKGGRLKSKGWGANLGFNGFVPSHENEQEDIPCQVLVSESLTIHWPFLDEFEGSEYRRILAIYEIESGEKGIGYVYAING